MRRFLAAALQRYLSRQAEVYSEGGYLFLRNEGYVYPVDRALTGTRQREMNHQPAVSTATIPGNE